MLSFRGLEKLLSYRKWGMVLCFCLLCPLISLGQNFGKQYIQQHRDLALALSDSFGIPAALILAVAMVESGAGNSRNARILNNHFGMKAGSKLRMVKGIKTRYRYYENDSASYADFCLYLCKRKFYPKLKGQMNPNLWINAMAKSGYSSAPKEWKKRIRSQIKKHKLTELQINHAGTKPQP